jgi:hypothetical protein
VGYESEPNERAERLIWLEAAMVDRLSALRGTGESYSDAILRCSSGGRDPRDLPIGAIGAGLAGMLGRDWILRRHRGVGLWPKLWERGKPKLDERTREDIAL